MTKEEIQAQIDLLVNIDHTSSNTLRFTLPSLINSLKKQLVTAKSIQDLQREAFEDGRMIGNKHYSSIRLIENSKDFGSNSYFLIYTMFEDYLKNKENE